MGPKLRILVAFQDQKIMALFVLLYFSITNSPISTKIRRFGLNINLIFSYSQIAPLE